MPWPIDPRPWRVWLYLTPFVDVPDDRIGIILNVALFAPLGVLLPLVARVGSARQVATYGFLVSLGIATVQFVGAVTVSPGRIADVDDLIGNTVGALLGYAVYRLLATISVLDRFLRSAALLGATGPVRV